MIVADDGLEPSTLGYEPNEIPFLQSTMFVPKRGIEPRLPVLQTGALPTELSRHKECFRYIHKPMWTRRESNPQLRFAKPVCSR